MVKIPGGIGALVGQGGRARVALQWNTPSGYNRPAEYTHREGLAGPVRTRWRGIVDQLRLLPTLVLLTVGQLTSDVRAGVVVGLYNEGSYTLHEIAAVQPGESFLIDVTVDTDLQIFDIAQIRFVASEAHVFTLAGGFFHEPWIDGMIWRQDLNRRSSPFIIVVPDPDYFGPGIGTVATLEMTVNPAAPEGIYSIGIAGGEHRICRTCAVTQPISHGPPFVVNVVPEPATLLLLLSGTALLLKPRR